ncbi:MAG: MCE family protein [Streptosporangiales bacterium]|nr:MCE family protein [Streptosporangiales bacterium]
MADNAGAVERSAVLIRIRHRLYGLVLVAILAVLGGVTVALYNKAFTDTVPVTLLTSRAGLQMLPQSDVKVRGMIVGEVREIDVTETGAALHLAIKPEKAGEIPGNVTARLTPKTLFGEKYVDLQMPKTAGPPIAVGAVVRQDNSVAAVELDRVLNNLLPVLKAVKPEELNATLNALATALDGRGDQIGRNIEIVDGYLRKINPHLPTILHDLRAIGDVSSATNQAAPDLLRLLRNLLVTNRTIVSQERRLVRLIDQGQRATDTTNAFLMANENKIWGVQFANRPAFEVMAKYSPQLPCVLHGIAEAREQLEAASGGKDPMIHVTLEVVRPKQGYKAGLDAPEYNDHRGPRCYGLPNNPIKPFPQMQVLDGTEDGGGDPLMRSMSAYLGAPAASTAEDEESVVNTVMAPTLGMPAYEVPDIASLLLAPSMRGSVVTVQ